MSRFNARLGKYRRSTPLEEERLSSLKRDCPNCGKCLGPKDLPLNYNGHGYLVATCAHCGAQLTFRKYRLDTIVGLVLLAVICLGATVVFRYRAPLYWFVIFEMTVILVFVIVCIILIRTVGKSRQRYVVWRLYD